MLGTQTSQVRANISLSFIVALDILTGHAITESEILNSNHSSNNSNVKKQNI